MPARSCTQNCTAQDPGGARADLIDAALGWGDNPGPETEDALLDAVAAFRGAQAAAEPAAHAPSQFSRFARLVRGGAQPDRAARAAGGTGRPGR